VIYKAVDPKDVQPGDRVVHLGRLLTVVGVEPAKAGEPVRFGFLAGETASFSGVVTIVDEVRTRELLSRYG
jgi:hypothetical protein